MWRRGSDCKWWIGTLINSLAVGVPSLSATESVITQETQTVMGTVYSLRVVKRIYLSSRFLTHFGLGRVRCTGCP